MGAKLGVVATLAAVLLVGCGGGGGGDAGYVEPKGPAAETVVIESSNFAFDPDHPRAAAGIAKLELDNNGGVHALVFDDGDYPGFQLEVSGGGDTSALKIDLEPGEYVFYCNIPGHRQQGMEGTLTVS